MTSFKPVGTDIEMGPKDLAKEGSLSTVTGSPGAQKQTVDGACILLNIASTVFLVFLNKWYVDMIPKADSACWND